MRALIAGIVHESSTFMVEITGPTGQRDFDVHVGPELLAEFTGTNTCVGGYLAACQRHAVTAVPALHARAEPGAAVDPAAYVLLADRLVELARAAGPVDIVLLDLHGAGTLVGGASLELDLLARIRALVGPDCPVAATLDLHANVPVRLPVLADVLVGFLEYPHTDMAERAELATGLAIDAAAGRLRPVTRSLDLPMLLPPSPTRGDAAAEARELARAASAAPGVLACTVFHGFPYADVPQASTSVVTVATDAERADEVNVRIGGWLWEHREHFRAATLSPAAAVSQALAVAGPVVIGDGTDNPGCGATGDSTYLLRALLDSGARCCLATVYDPATVASAVAAGVGADIDVLLGGRHGWASGPPVSATAIVRAITDGRVVQQAMRRGKVLDFGPSVRLQIGSVDVISSTRRRQVLDPEILLLHGMLPERYDIVAVKSVSHFRAGFSAVSDQLLVADAPGPLTREIETLPRQGPTTALWPMNPSARWVGDQESRLVR